MQWRRRTTYETQAALAVLAVLTDLCFWGIYALDTTVVQLVIALVLAAVAAIQIARIRPARRRAKSKLG
jgi:predicted PurR-regulated permease PerM